MQTLSGSALRSIGPDSRIGTDKLTNSQIDRLYKYFLLIYLLRNFGTPFLSRKIFAT
jgi:hypothetical protein